MVRLKKVSSKNSSRNKPRNRGKGEKSSNIMDKDGLNKTIHLLLSPLVLAPLYGKEFQKCSGISQHYILDRLLHYTCQYLYICRTLNCLISSWLGGWAEAGLHFFNYIFTFFKKKNPFFFWLLFVFLRPFKTSNSNSTSSSHSNLPKPSISDHTY